LRTCEICEGKGWYLESDPVYECMVKEECLDCKYHDMYREDITEHLYKLFRDVSPVKVAMLLAEFIVNSVDANPKDNLNRLDEIVMSKNTRGIMLLGKGYANALKEE
tara:strand:+ start:8569 stop:8889 length:321 start_codon:yes stop_codon:yes gene_type:complete